MALNDRDLHAQGKACIEVGQEEKGNPFFARYGPMVEDAVTGYADDLKAIGSTEAAMRLESDQSRAACKKLNERVTYHLGMVTIEMPHLDRTSLGDIPGNRGEILLFVDSFIEMVEEQGAELYNREEVLDEMGVLENDARTELDESSDAEELFHKAVAQKNGSREKLRTVIRVFKAGARRVHGVKSRQYRTLRDSAFKGKGGKPPKI